MTHYYEVHDLKYLDVEGVRLWLRISCEDWLGFVKFTPSSEIKFRIGTPLQSEDLPKHAKVDAWRPVNPETFPDDLPEPMKLQPEVDWKSPPEPPHSPPEPQEPDYGWPYPNIRLGRPGEPPESVLECEARILRCLRTIDALEWEPIKTEKAWPPELLVSAQVLHKLLSASRTGKLGCLKQDDYQDFHIDYSDLRPLPQRWRPTPRDISDVEHGHILSWIPSDAERWFYWRSARPPYSFRQIGEYLNAPEDVIREEYEDVCQKAFEIARG
ncbi:MAG: hypothetical protein RIC14_05505 [Filomicrobium sp.]